MRQKTNTTFLRRSATRLMAITTAFLATVCWPGQAANGQSVIDMPPPRAVSVQAESNEATSSIGDVGAMAMSRYGWQRAGATNTYGMYNRRYRRSYGYGYGYPVLGYHGYGFGHPGYGCYGGASIRHVGGGRFVGTLLYR